MALVLECDGCEQKLDSDTAKRFGRIEPAYYCQDCAKKWEHYIDLEKEFRNALLKTFAEFRNVGQESLGLKRFPDG